MNEVQSPFHRPVKKARTVGRCCNAKATKSLLPWQWQWTRKSLVAVTTLLTVAVFLLDMLMNDWSMPNSAWQWVIGDGSLIFYVLGFASAYFFLTMSRSVRRPSTKGKVSSTAGTKQVREQASIAPPSRSAVSSPQRRLPAEKSFSKEDAVKHGPSSDSCRPGQDASLASFSSSASKKSCMNVNHAISQATVRGAEHAAAVLKSLEAEGKESDATSYNLVIRAYSKSNDCRGIEYWFNRMKSRGLEPNEYSYNTVMNAYAKADDVATVEVWMKRMQADQVACSGISYAIVIHANARKGDVAAAEKWLNNMSNAGFTPDCVNYNSLIHACSIRKDAEGAEHWFEKLVEQGHSPTIMTYTSLVDACSKALKVEKAEKWMQQLLDLGLEPNVVSFSAMIDACARVSDIKKAECWYAKMREAGVQPNAYIFSAVINACAKACDVSAAISWLQQAEESGTTLDAVVYGCVINACGKAGDSQSAMRAFRQMRSHGIQTHVVVYGALARPFAYAGDYEEVERIQCEMLKDGIAMNDFTLYMLLLSYSRAKPRMAEKAELAFHKALSEGIQPNDRVIKALSSAVGRARCGQLLDSR